MLGPNVSLSSITGEVLESCSVLLTRCHSSHTLLLPGITNHSFLLLSNKEHCINYFILQTRSLRCLVTC